MRQRASAPPKSLSGFLFVAFGSSAAWRLISVRCSQVNFSIRSSGKKEEWIEGRDLAYQWDWPKRTTTLSQMEIQKELNFGWFNSLLCWSKRLKLNYKIQARSSGRLHKEMCTNQVPKVPEKKRTIKECKQFLFGDENWIISWSHFYLCVCVRTTRPRKKKNQITGKKRES